MSTANKTTDSNEVVINVTLNINVSGNVIWGKDNIIAQNESQSNKSIEKKSALGELFSKAGNFIGKLVSKIKAWFLPRV